MSQPLGTTRYATSRPTCQKCVPAALTARPNMSLRNCLSCLLHPATSFVQHKPLPPQGDLYQIFMILYNVCHIEQRLPASNKPDADWLRPPSSSSVPTPSKPRIGYSNEKIPMNVSILRMVPDRGWYGRTYIPKYRATLAAIVSGTASTYKLHSRTG